MKKKSSALLAGVLFFACIPANATDLTPYVTGSKKAKHQKATFNQRANGHWQYFDGIQPYALNGDRALFFAQLHLKCSKKPRYAKIRLARLLPNGRLDTTGTNTWVLGENASKTPQMSLWWESKTKYPIIAQFKVVGGHCVSPERQFKFWQP